MDINSESDISNEEKEEIYKMLRLLAMQHKERCRGDCGISICHMFVVLDELKIAVKKGDEGCFI